MFNLKSNIVIVCLFICTTVANNDTKTAIGFPEMEEDPKLINKDNRQPVFLPAKCPVNELYYPGDQKDDWICDCRPAFLYHPSSDQCWPALQQGPCTEGQHLILREDSAIPVCEKNPCNDGFVMYEGKCYQLGTQCGGRQWPQTSVIAVNAVNLSVHCEMLNVGTRFSEMNAPVAPVFNEGCPVGCKRSISGKCIPNPKK